MLLLSNVARRRTGYRYLPFLCALCLLFVFTSASISSPQIADTPLAEAPVSDTVDGVSAEPEPLPSDPQAVIQTKPRTLSKVTLGLAAAGLLTIPFDKRLVDGMSRTPTCQRSDAFTETANKFGDRNLLLAGIGSMYLLGNDHNKDTAKMALSALISSGTMTEGLKMLSGRGRPGAAVDPGGFAGPSLSGGRASFPSGHTSAAFAVATVMAHRKPKHKWLFYGLAAAVGMARVRKSAHYPSDVLMGAGVGIYAGNRAASGNPSFFPIRIGF